MAHVSENVKKQRVKEKVLSYQCEDCIWIFGTHVRSQANMEAALHTISEFRRQRKKIPQVK